MEKIKAELGKLREMKFKEKLDYIWEYYRFHIITIVGVLAIVIGLLNSLVFNPPKTNLLGIAFYGTFIDNVETEKMEVALANIITENSEDSKVYITNFFMDNSDDNYSSMNVQKFVAMCSAKQIDIFIAEKDLFTETANRDFLLDLSTVDGINFKTEEMFYSHMADDTETMYPFGIPLKSSAFLKNAGFVTDDLYLGIILNSERLLNSIEAVNYIISES